MGQVRKLANEAKLLTVNSGKIVWSSLLLMPAYQGPAPKTRVKGQ
jgi:hypothetical protein